MADSHVVIIGGGFAGLSAGKLLAKSKDLQVTLIDHRNFHLFQPLLYQVATAGLSPGDIAVPIRGQFSTAPNVTVRLGHVESVDLGGNTVALRDGNSIHYDYLIMACGAAHSYFGRNEWEQNAPGLKTLEQATEIRRRILSAFEAAENEEDAAVQRALLTFVIVGAGPTGVELAGAIADISHTVLVKDFRRINPASARVVLVEAGPRILAGFEPDMSARAESDLKKIGVEVRVSARVENIDDQGVQVGNERIPARNAFWAAGVQAEKLATTLKVPLDRAGRVVVGPDLTVPGFPNAFVVGDIAHFEPTEGKPLPGLAPVAIQSGRSAARNILNSVRGKPRVPFSYTDKGIMAAIGKNSALAQTGKLKLTGYIAWVAWLFVHILYLIGFKNRVSVLAQWFWSYLFSKRGARLITSKDWRLNKRVAEPMGAEGSRATEP